MTESVTVQPKIVTPEFLCILEGLDPKSDQFDALRDDVFCHHLSNGACAFKHLASGTRREVGSVRRRRVGWVGAADTDNLVFAGWLGESATHVLWPDKPSHASVPRQYSNPLMER